MSTVTRTGRRTHTGASVLSFVLPVLAARGPGRQSAPAHAAPSGPSTDAWRARNRIAAFVYGNLTLLPAVLTTTSSMASDGHAFALVIVAAVTVFVAHALSDLFAHRIAPAEGNNEDHSGLRAELRDALPIATAAAVPLLAFGLDWMGVLTAPVAQAAAAAVIIIRLAATGLVVEHLQPRRPAAVTVWTGIALAVAGTALAIAKVLLIH